MLGSLAVTLNGTVVDPLSSRRTRHCWRIFYCAGALLYREMC